MRFEKGHTPWNKGLTKENNVTIKRIAESRRGYKFSEESKRKISKSHKKGFEDGRVPWNKGIPRRKETKRKMSESKKGAKNPMYGKHHSEEHKQKLSESNRGENNAMYGRTGDKHPKYGIRLSAESRKKISEAKKGDKHPNWMGGISFEPYSPEFNKSLKREIRSRDNYTCQKCGVLESELNTNLSVHHIDYDKKNCDKKNLVALCGGCNVKVNSDRQYWENHFKRKVSYIV